MAIAYALRIAQSGIQQSVDTATYSRWADLLISLDFDLPAYLRAQEFVAPPLTYLLWITVVAGLKTMLGSSWMTGAVVLNWIALSAGVYATIAVVRATTRSTAAMLMSAALFTAAAELLIFVPYVLSDLMFWGLSTGVLACGVGLAIGGDDRVKAARVAILGSLLLAAALMFRPVAVPLLLFWATALLLRQAPPLADRLPVSLLTCAAALALIAIVAEAFVLARPSAWPFGALPPILVMVGDEARQGMFVHNANPPMLVAPAADLGGFLRIAVQKLAFFITPWLPHYSSAHTLFNLVFFVPAYGLSIAAIANRQRLTAELRRAACLLASFIVMLWTFHAMLLIDSDHRYRLPMLPALIMLAAIGLESVRRPRTLASIARAR